MLKELAADWKSISVIVRKKSQKGGKYGTSSSNNTKSILCADIFRNRSEVATQTPKINRGLKV